MELISEASKNTTELLKARAWIGWAAGRQRLVQEDLEAALDRFVRRRGRPCSLVAMRDLDGLVPPPGCELVAWAIVPKGCLFLALPDDAL